MVTILKSGTLTKNQRPSYPKLTKENLWTLRMLEKERTSKFGTPTADGFNCGDMTEKDSTMSIRRTSDGIYKVEKI